MTDGIRFFQNAPLAYGRGSLAHLSRLEGRRVAIITDDAAMEEHGFLDQALGYLEEAGLETLVVARISAEPSTADINAAKLALIDFNADWIVALGGGSVLDSAKALWVFAEHPEMSWEEVFTFNGLPPIRRVHLAAVPSTSGTGSETSRVSVIIDQDSSMKRLIFSPEIIPTLAILDPNLADTMPQWLTAASAFDALSHAIESSIATIANEFTVSLALSAIRLIFKHLPAAYQNNESHAREQVHYAATITGMAINNSTAGLAHGMDQVGPRFGIAHGIVCAILLPYTIGFSLDAAAGRFAEMGSVLNLKGRDENELGKAFLRELVALQRSVDLPLAFKDVDIGVDEFLLQLEEMVAAAQDSGSTHLSPRVPTADELRNLFLYAYHERLPEALIR